MRVEGLSSKNKLAASKHLLVLDRCKCVELTFDIDYFTFIIVIESGQLSTIAEIVRRYGTGIPVAHALKAVILLVRAH